MRTLHILQDTRENKPLPFPSTLTALDSASPPHSPKSATYLLRIVEQALPFADYCLADEAGGVYTVDRSGTVIVERKFSLRELETNCFQPSRRQRFVACLDRMADSFSRPFLLLEGTLSRLYASGDKQPAALTLDAMQRLCLERGVTPLILEGNAQSNRRLIADYVARLLLNGQLTNGANTVRQLRRLSPRVQQDPVSGVAVDDADRGSP